MSLFDAVTEVLKPWAFEYTDNSVYVARGNVAFVQEHLKKRGFDEVRVLTRSTDRREL